MKKHIQSKGPPGTSETNRETRINKGFRDFSFYLVATFVAHL